MKAVMIVGVAVVVAIGLGIGWMIAGPPVAPDVMAPSAKAHAKTVISPNALAAAALRIQPEVVMAGLRGDPDPDTVPTKHNTFGLFGTQVTFAQARPGEMASPRYLPAWGPVYPGAVLKQKLAQRKDGHLVGRGTVFGTDDDFEKVKAFYDGVISAKSIVPQHVTNGKYAKVYMFDRHGDVQSILNVRNNNTGDGHRKVEITIVQAMDE